jgi:hypothetical protein
MTFLWENSDQKRPPISQRKGMSRRLRLCQLGEHLIQRVYDRPGPAEVFAITV